MIDSHVSLLRLIDVLDYLLDENVGIIQYVEEVKREPGTPNFFHFGCRACNTQAFSQQKNFSFTGGASAKRELAIARSVGEAVERYCAALFELEELPLSSYEASPFPCIPPDDFALYSKEQYERPDFPFVPFNNATPVRWTPALEPLTAEICYVPAAMVYVPYLYYQGDAPIVQPISTGLACHCSPEEAAISAICEVVERDAFTITWQARLSMPHIHLDSLSSANHELVKRFEQTGNAVTLLNITMDTGIPTILSVLQSESPDAPALVFAAATDLDPEQAICKSLEELAHTRRYSQQIKSGLPRLTPERNHENVVEQVSHLNFWCDHVNAPLANFIFASKECIAFETLENLSMDNPKRNLKNLLDRVRDIHYRVFLADLTTPDVRDLGLSVIRAVIPGFHPLFMGHYIRALGGHRLWEVPQKIGHKGITPESGDNGVPHPYP